MTKFKPEPVYHVSHFHDRPRQGIADFLGKPHFFDCQFSRAEDDWSDIYLLTEIDVGTVALAEESDRLFVNWLTAYNAGRTTLEGHPVLPHDRVRHEEVKAILGEKLVTDPTRAVLMHGTFDMMAKRSSPFVPVFGPIDVLWRLPESED